MTISGLGDGGGSATIQYRGCITAAMPGTTPGALSEMRTPVGTQRCWMGLAALLRAGGRVFTPPHQSAVRSFTRAVFHLMMQYQRGAVRYVEVPRKAKSAEAWLQQSTPALANTEPASDNLN